MPPNALHLSSKETTSRAALLTPPGAAAIAVVRFIGPAVASFISAHLSRPLTPLRTIHCELTDDAGRVIDDPVAMLSDNGARSSLDLNLHGGPWVVRECLELARQSGFEVMEPIDHGFNDPPDPGSAIERDMIEAIPLARTEQALRMLLAQPGYWRDLAGMPTGMVQDRLIQLIEDHSLWWMLHPPRVAIVGPANAGKSTLANQLIGRERSITADEPGTTRDWVGEWANLDGLAVLLLDTPGQRESDDPIEQSAIQQSQREIDAADLVLVVLDPTQPLSQQLPIRDRYPAGLIVINKSDLAARWDISPIDGIPTIATNSEGVAALQEQIRGRFGSIAAATVDEIQARWWTKRQRDLLRTAADEPGSIADLLNYAGGQA